MGSWTQWCDNINRKVFNMTNLIPRRHLGRLSLFRDDFLFPLQCKFDEFFNDFFNDSNLIGIKASSGYPKMNVLELDDKLVVKVSVPGTKPEDLEVEVIQAEEGRSAKLVISGKTSEEYSSPKEAIHHVRELRQSSFRRELALPQNLEGEPEAVLQDGVLILSWNLPEREKEARQLIEIKTK